MSKVKEEERPRDETPEATNTSAYPVASQTGNAGSLNRTPNDYEPGVAPDLMAKARAGKKQPDDPETKKNNENHAGPPANGMRISRNDHIKQETENQTSQGESVMQNMDVAPRDPSKIINREINMFEGLYSKNRHLEGGDKDADQKKAGDADEKLAAKKEDPEAANKAAQRRNRRKVLPMIDFDEQDAYIKKMQQQANQANKDEPASQPKNQKKGKVVGNYVLGRDLGKGTFGEVMVGTHSLTGEKVAIKVLEKEKIIDVHDVERVAREIHILKIVRHPTIVQLYEIIETDKELYLIMEYARGGELFEYIVNRKRVRERDACKFLHQILSGVQYLHNLGICHRDLKPENLLMDDFNNIKIVDFGLSNTFKEGDSLQTACGSPCYAAPEMVAGQKYDGQAADMWSVGVIIYAMVCGFLPFEDPKTNKLYQKILNAEYSIPEFVSEPCQELIRKILCPNPQERLSIDEIRSHPWYQQVKVREFKGIYVGKNPIPVDVDIIRQISEYEECDEQQAIKYVTNNRHNATTTIYYLILKKHIRKGGKSVADITKYKPEDFQPGTARNQDLADHRSAEVNEHKIQVKTNDNDQADKAQQHKNKRVTQIKLKKDIDASSKNPQYFSEVQKDPSEVEQNQDKLIAIAQQNSPAKEDAGQFNAKGQEDGEKPQVPSQISRGRGTGAEGSVSPSPHRYFQHEDQRPLNVPPEPTQARSNLTTQRLNPHKNFQIQGQGGGDQVAQETESIEYTRHAKMASREQRHGSQPPVSSVMGLTPLQPLHQLDQEKDVNQSVNSFKNMGMSKKSKQMHILINESNQAAGHAVHPKLSKMPALPKHLHRDRYELPPQPQPEADYHQNEYLYQKPYQETLQQRQIMAMNNGYKQRAAQPGTNVAPNRPTKSRHSIRQNLNNSVQSNHAPAVALKAQKMMGNRREQGWNYHSSMGNYTTSDPRDGAADGDQHNLQSNMFVGQQTQESEKSPVPYARKMGNIVGGAGPQAMNYGQHAADTNRKVRRSVNVVQSKFNASLNPHQQQHNLFSGQAEEAPNFGRNVAMVNVNNKFMNHSLNFADQQSAGSDLNYEAAVAHESNIFQQTQQLMKPQKRGTKKNQTQFQQMQLIQMSNAGQTQALVVPGLRQKNHQPALLQNRQNVKGIRSTRGATVALERQQYQSQEQVVTQQMASELQAMGPPNQPNVKKGHHQLVYHPQANQTEMNFYSGTANKPANGKFVFNHKQLGYHPEQFNLPNMPGQPSQNARLQNLNQPNQNYGQSKQQHQSNMSNMKMVQQNFQNIQMNLKHIKRGSNEANDRLPTRGGGTHARYNSDVSSILQRDGRPEQMQVVTASSNKDSNQALSGASRVSGVSYISEVNNKRMLGSVEITGNLADIQVPAAGDFSKSSKRKNRQIAFYPELNAKPMPPAMEPKNQTYMQFYPGEVQNAPNAQLTLNRNPKISNKYESLRHKQNQRILNQSYDFSINAEQLGGGPGKNARQQADKAQHAGRKIRPNNQGPMDDYAFHSTQQVIASVGHNKAVYLNPVVHPSLQFTQKMPMNSVKNEQPAYLGPHNQSQKLEEIQNIIRKSQQKQPEALLKKAMGQPRNQL